MVVGCRFMVWGGWNIADTPITETQDTNLLKRLICVFDLCM